MLEIVTIGVFLLVALVVAGFGYRAYTRPARVLENLSSPSTSYGAFDAVGLQPEDTREKFKISTALQWLGEKAPMSPQDASLTRKLLAAAGYRKDGALKIFIGVRLASLVAGLAVAGLFISTTSFPPLVDLLLLVAGAGVGYWLPGLILEEILIPGYQHKLRRALPDALDMLVICVESGISLDQALRTVAHELMITHPELCRELNLVSVEMRAGLRRAQALKNLAERTMEPELGKLVAMLIQTDRFGTSVGDALRAHADFMRVRRRQEAEEKAGKLSVKLIFPIFFLILPAIFLVAVGPAIISISKNLMPALGG